MTYILVKNRKTIVGKPVSSYQAALHQAIKLFGNSTQDWINLNLRIEEARA